MTGKVGIVTNGFEICVMHIPQRKKPCLFVKPKDENCYYKVASFNSEETADWFLKQLEETYARCEP